MQKLVMVDGGLINQTPNLDLDNRSLPYLEEVEVEKIIDRWIWRTMQGFYNMETQYTRD